MRNSPDAPAAIGAEYINVWYNKVITNLICKLVLQAALLFKPRKKGIL